MKIKTTALKFSSSIAYFNKIPFSGTSLEFDGALLSKTKKFTNGLPVELRDDNYIKASDGLRQVDAGFLTSVDEDYREPALFNGALFTGIAYYFEDNFCCEECCFEDGLIASNVSYFKDGRLESIELINDDFAQEHNWYESGAVKSFQYSGHDKFHSGMDFDQYGRIESASISVGYFSGIKRFQDEIKFNWMDEDVLRAYDRCSERLFLSGDGVDDEIFEILTNGDKLNDSSTIELYKTAVTRNGLTYLLNCNAVKKLVIKSPTIDRDDCDWFRRQRPDCDVEYSIPDD
jgi:hypothetical protein